MSNNPLAYKLGQIRKAVAGALAPVVPLTGIALADPETPLHITRLEAGGIAGASVVAFFAVFFAKNAPKTTAKKAAAWRTVRRRKPVDPAPNQD